MPWEARCLFEAAPPVLTSTGSLVIVGTEADDRIAITIAAGEVVVDVNGSVSSFDGDGGAGDDAASIDDGPEVFDLVFEVEATS
jgi:hypothetical protein